MIFLFSSWWIASTKQRTKKKCVLHLSCCVLYIKTWIFMIGTIKLLTSLKLYMHLKGSVPYLVCFFVSRRYLSSLFGLVCVIIHSNVQVDNFSLVYITKYFECIMWVSILHNINKLCKHHIRTSKMQNTARFYFRICKGFQV